MKKTDLITKIHEDYGVTKKDAEVMVETTFNTLCNVLLTGEEVYIYGLGKFSTYTRSAKVGRNPKTGESVAIPERKILKFTPAKSLAEGIAN